MMVIHSFFPVIHEHTPRVRARIIITLASMETTLVASVKHGLLLFFAY